MSPSLLIVGAASAMCALGALCLLRTLEARSRLANRVAAVQQSLGSSQGTPTRSPNRLLQIVSSVGITMARSGVLSDKTLLELKQTLAVAGFRGSSGLGLFIGSKLLLLTMLPLIGWFGLLRFGVSGSLQNCGALACAVAGLLGPDLVIKKLRAGYLAQIDKGLPDALDMMVICSEAGLGLEPSISRVAAEITSTHPAVATELWQTASELRVISDRRLALQNMGTRTGLEGLKRLGATLIQTTHYGTPVSQALRTLSAEMRGEVLTRFEERAARLPVLLTVPMIVFVLPTVFVVVGGPALLHVIAILHH